MLLKPFSHLSNLFFTFLFIKKICSYFRVSVTSIQSPGSIWEGKWGFLVLLCPVWVTVIYSGGMGKRQAPNWRPLAIGGVTFGRDNMRISHKLRMLTLVFLFSSVLGFGMMLPSVAASETVIYDVSELITQGELQLHVVMIPDGVEVKIEMGWDEPTGVGYDLDFYVFDGGFLAQGASVNNPEMAFLGGFATPTEVYIWVEGFWAPDPGVEYYLRVVVGPDVIPDPYAESGGLSVGDLQSWHNAPAVAIYEAAPNAAFKWSSESNFARQVIMPFYSWFGVYWGSGWLGPTYYAGDPLIVGGVTRAIPYDNEIGVTNIKQAQTFFRSLVIEIFIDGIPLEDLGNPIQHTCRPDHYLNRWYYREPKVLFHPGELYDLLPKTEDDLHTFEYRYNGETVFFDYFYLLW